MAGPRARLLRSSGTSIVMPFGDPRPSHPYALECPSFVCPCAAGSFLLFQAEDPLELVEARIVGLPARMLHVLSTQFG